MQITPRLALSVVALASLLASCGASDADGTDGGAAETTVAEATESETTVAEATAAGSEAGLAVLADGEAPPERTISVSADGFEPDTLTIAAGENVTFKASDDGIYAVLVGSLDGATVNGGLIETFDFPDAGTYPVLEDISGAQATVIVTD